MAKQELVATIRDRYQQSSKKDKGRILDEFTAITGHHRKHGIRLLSGTADNQGKQVLGRRIYDESVREAVIVVWEASDRISGKRLKAALPNLVNSMVRIDRANRVPAARWMLTRIDVSGGGKVPPVARPDESAGVADAENLGAVKLLGVLSVCLPKLLDGFPGWLVVGCFRP